MFLCLCELHKHIAGVFAHNISILLPSALPRGFEWGIYSHNVSAYIRTYVSVTLRNVNLRQRLGMSVWGRWSRPGKMLDTTCITRWHRDDFFGDEDGENSAAGPLQCTYLAESSAEASAECSRWLATLTKNKTKISVHHRSQESKERTRKSSTVEITYWSFFTARYFRLTLHFTVVLCCS